MADAYVVLGLEPDASVAEIESRYRELAKVAHPDVSGDEHLFVELRLAYEQALLDAKQQNREPAVSESPPRPKPWTIGDAAAEELAWSVVFYPLAFAVGLPFVAIWSLTGSLPLALVGTPIIATGVWFLGGRFLQWWRSI